LSFTPPGDLSSVGAIVLTAEQKIIVSGSRPLGFGAYGWGAFRLDQRGNLETGLGGGAYSLAVQPDDKLVSGLANFSRINPDGAADPGFVPTQLMAVVDEVRAFALQPDGKILFGGRIHRVQDHPCVLVGRLDPNGRLDLGFDSSGGFDQPTGSPASAYALALDAHGRVLAGGLLGTFRGQAVPPLIRLNGGPSPRLPLDFVSAPTDQRVSVGATVTWSVLTTGYPNPDYQWWRDGQAIPGATNAALTLTNVQIADFGSYRIVASNSYEVVQAQATLDIGVFTQPGSLDPAFRPTCEPFCEWNSLAAVLRNGNLVVAVGEYSTSW
jgi:uncharacterized delta-60 repeat protein